MGPFTGIASTSGVLLPISIYVLLTAETLPTSLRFPSVPARKAIEASD